MNFGNWPAEIHKDHEQISRIDGAINIKSTDITINNDDETAIINGSSAYEVSLTNCTCKDFSIRKLPCKHIYRLASELGLAHFPMLNRDMAKKFKENIPAEIKRYETLYESGAISGKKYVAIAKALQSK